MRRGATIPGALAVSFLAHLGLVWLPLPEPLALVPSDAVEITVVPVPPPAPAPPPVPAPVPVPVPDSVASTERPVTSRRHQPTPAPDEAPPGRYTSFRSVPRAPEPSSSDPTPTPGIPDPGTIMAVPGAPPANQLPPGALGDGPVRAPPPFVPGDGPGPLGPKFRPAGDGGHVAKRPGFDARVARDGTIRFKDEGSFKPWKGKFDWSDALMRKLGQDPYRAEKRKVMDETREARAEMAREDRTDRLREAIAKLPRYLARVWAEPRWSPAQKRRILFDLWDEVVEVGDPELVRAGEMVRAQILGFIQRELPAGTPDGYTAAEIDRFNAARTSREIFAPY